MIWHQLHKIGADLDLVMVGRLEPRLDAWVEQHISMKPYLHILDFASNKQIIAFYNTAAALLFPSHCEGFGWPILEALACGCPIVTTDRPPMSDVAGDSATLLPPCPEMPADIKTWALQAAILILEALQRPHAQQQHAREQGFLQASQFDYSVWLDQLETHYQRALALKEYF